MVKDCKTKAYSRIRKHGPFQRIIIGQRHVVVYYDKQEVSRTLYNPALHGILI